MGNKSQFSSTDLIIISDLDSKKLNKVPNMTCQTQEDEPLLSCTIEAGPASQTLQKPYNTNSCNKTLSLNLNNQQIYRKNRQKTTQQQSISQIDNKHANHQHWRIQTANLEHHHQHPAEAAVHDKKGEKSNNMINVTVDNSITTNPAKSGPLMRLHP